MRSLLLLVPIALLVACQPRPQPEEEAAAEAPRVSEPAAPKRPAPPKESAMQQGLLDMERLASGKRFQGTWIHLDDGSSLLLGYRPIPEYFGFVEKRVVFTGEHYMPEGQAVGADHFRITKIELAPGEVAYDPVPTSLPKPPILRDRPALQARDGRWVQVVGTLLPGRALKDGSIEMVETSIRIADGSIVMSRTAASYYARDWRALEGQVVTSLGKLRVDHGALRLGYASSVCAGEVDGCGMPTPRGSGKKPSFKP